MKRNSDIASLFQKPETKKAAVAAAATSKCSLDPVEPVVEEQTLGRVIWSCCLVCQPSILLTQDIFSLKLMKMMYSRHSCLFESVE